MSFSTPAEQAEAMLNFPLLDGDLRGIGENIDFLDEFAEHLFPDEFWSADLNPDLFAASEIPVFMFEGWFDFFAGGMLADWTNLMDRRGGADQFIVVGPWPHLMGFTEQDHPFPDGRTVIDFVPEMVAFFDRYLKGEETFQVPRARYYDGGTGAWRFGPTLWPTATRAWRLYADLAVTRPTCAGTAGALAATPPATAATARYVYDPEDPVILRAANILDLYGRDGMQVDNDWCTRDDVLLFESAPLTAPVELGGELTVHLDVATDAPDTSFLARLSLVDTDGTAYNLREGAMLLTHRDGGTEPAAYAPGTTVHVAIPLPALRWTLQPGQRLRLVVTSSGYPFIAPYPNTGDGWPRAPEPITATQTLATGATRSTGLTLTVAQ
jgi:putative CocE/NonD family hydrolase